MQRSEVDRPLGGSAARWIGRSAGRSLAITLPQPNRATERSIHLAAFGLDISGAPAQPRANPNHNSPYEDHLQAPGWLSPQHRLFHAPSRERGGVERGTRDPDYSRGEI